MFRAVFVLAVACVAAGSSLRGLQGGYSTSSAMQSGYLATIAYCPQEQIMAWNCAYCSYVSGIKPLTYAYYDSLNVAAYVADLGNGVGVVSFRGTQETSLKNWIADLEAAKTTPLAGCEGCEVHEGFHNSYMGLQQQILNGLNGVEGLSSLIITGHSLGAAMAALCAWDLSNRGFNVETVYTFGQPRVGNPAFATAYASYVPEYRVVHHDDIVPHLPPEALGFHHVPTEVWYSEDSSTYQVCDGSGEDDNCSDSVSFIHFSVDDHLDYLNIKMGGCEPPSTSA